MDLGKIRAQALTRAIQYDKKRQEEMMLLVGLLPLCNYN